MFISNKINYLSAFMGRTAPALASILVLTMVFFLVNGSYLYSDDQVVPGDEYQPTPCSSLYPGYYYSGEYYGYHPVLFSDMPYDIMISNVLLDSVKRNLKNIFTEHFGFDTALEHIECEDTIFNLVMKHFYRLEDYTPYFFIYSFGGYTDRSYLGMESQIWKRSGEVCGLPKEQVGKSTYILHITTNTVEHWEFQGSPDIRKVECKINTVIKGQVLPDINSLVEVFYVDSNDIRLTKSRGVTVNPNTDFIFHYTDFNVSNKGITKTFPEIKPETEYIAFVWQVGFDCINEQTKTTYFKFRPSLVGLSGGMYPIVNGNVFDEYDDFGWGTSVPLNTFLLNLQEVIDSIVNYGE